MKGRRDVLLGSYFGCEPLSKVGGKSRVSVSDNLFGEAEPGIDVFEVQGCYPRSRNCGRAWKEQGRMRTAVVDNSENGVFSSYLGQASDQIHGDLLEWKGVFWGSDTIEGDSRSVRKVFVLLTRRAPGDVVGNPGFHPFPDQVVLGLSESLVPSRVSCRGVVMDQGHKVSFLCLRGCRYRYFSNELRWREDNHVPIVFLALFDVYGSG